MTALRTRLEDYEEIAKIRIDYEKLEKVETSGAFEQRAPLPWGLGQMSATLPAPLF